METPNYYIIDFDSTFVAVEALDELARLALKNSPDREEKLAQIKEITRQENEGEISPADALDCRLKLMGANKSHFRSLSAFLSRNITASIKRNKVFFNDFAGRIYIVSTGFKDYIAPVVKAFNIKPDQVLANSPVFDREGNLTGFAKANPLTGESGKAKAIEALGLPGDVYMIGDGYGDLQVREAGQARTFVAFTENVRREKVAAKADIEAPNLDEFLFRHKLPRAQSYPKTRMKVLLLEKIDRRGADFFREQGYEVKTYDKALGPEELAQEIRNVSILGIRSKTDLTAQVLENANRLLCVGAFCIGTNQIDLAAASSKGIAVFNAPYSNTRSVVELVLGEMIMLYRNTFDKSLKLHRGGWDKSADGAHEIRGKKLGIIGYGNIGSQLSVLAESLGLVVYFYDISDKLALGNARPCKTMEEVLEVADIVSMHVDGRKANNNLIGAREFKRMKPGAIFINASRGSVVDVHAMAEAIKSKHIRGAAADVFPEEPRSNNDPFTSELQGLPNVILTPHIAGSTTEAQQNIADFVSAKLSNYVDNGDTTLSVNFPNLQLPGLANGHRFIHVHDNVPGILARINSLLAEHGLNVIGQYLKTNESMGYVITDVSSTYPEQVIEELAGIPKTVKFRVLF